MALYDGSPSIRLEGDEEAALSLIPRGKALLYKVQNFRKKAQVNTFSLTESFEEGTVYALSSLDQHIIFISAEPEVPGTIDKAEFPKPTSMDYWSFYSGLVIGGVYEQRRRTLPDGSTEEYEVCRVFSPTVNCAKIFDELGDGRQEVERLGILPYAGYSDIQGRNPRVRLTQYSLLKPSMYSGTMAKVVQLVMGLGKYGDGDDEKVQVKFDWHFHRTHGIYRSTEGIWWIVEINRAKGVLAMPLPIFPDTDKEGFMKQAEARKDKPMIEALKTLGCLPTGEGIPVARKLNEALEKGDVIRLASASDLGDFYNNYSFYSSSMGWCFSDAGDQAHNTGYRYAEDGFQRSAWYQININIGKIKKNRKKNEPIATGSASLALQQVGPIFAPPVRGRARYIKIKFHEPLLGHLLSHEGAPSIEAAGKPAPVCDTVMYVGIMNGELKTVKQFFDPYTDTYNKIEDSRQPGECMVAGSWTIVQYSGLRSTPRMMYSNDIDDRKVLSARVDTTKLKSKDLGYDPPRYSDFLQAPEANYIWRDKIFDMKVNRERKEGESVGSAIAIPAFCRNAYYYAYLNQFTSHSGSDGLSYISITDPNAAYGWRCFPFISAPPYPPDKDCDTRKCRGDGLCNRNTGAGNHAERRVICLSYEPGNPGTPWRVSSGGNCYEYADSGPWIQECENIEGFNQPAGPRPTYYNTWNKGRNPKTKLLLFADGQKEPVKIKNVTADNVQYAWYIPSPDPDGGGVQFISATYSVLGEDAVIFNEGLSWYSSNILTKGKLPDQITHRDGIPTFIGVNDQ